MTGHFRLSSTRITREARSVRAFNGPGQNPLPDRFYSNLQIPSSLSRKADHQDTHQRSAIPRVQNGTPGCEQPPRWWRRAHPLAAERDLPPMPLSGSAANVQSFDRPAAAPLDL